jgi:glucose/arabinose dehydrogenase
VTAPPGDVRRLFVVEQTGAVRILRDGELLPDPFLDLRDEVKLSSEPGLLSIAFAPDYAKSGLFYVFYNSTAGNGDIHITEFRRHPTDPNRADRYSERILLTITKPWENHNGGMLQFGPDGYLYASVGDGDSGVLNPPGFFAQRRDELLGNILRIDPRDGDPYAVPKDNPFVDLDGVRPEIWAYGLRNPWRFWIDPETGLLWVGDVGERAEEEISVGSGDRHYGYPFEEGARVWGDVEGMNCSDLTPGRPCSPPAYSYPVGDGASVTGGLIVEGCGWSNVFERPHYVFGDYEQNWVRALAVNEERSGFTDAEPIDVLSGNNAGPVSFRMGPDASLYVVFYRLGAVYRVTPADRSGPGCG